MTDLRIAAQQALEFAADIVRGKYKGNAEEIRDALRAALEQPEQEPPPLFTKYGPPTMRDRDFWSTGYATATARAIEAALKKRNA